MGIHIVRVREKGNLDEERLVLRADKDTNTSGLVVMDATFNEEGDVSNKGRHAYRFPPKEIDKGDFVVLYTRSKPENGKDHSVGDDGKTKTHFFYWDRDATVWNQDGDHCTLMRVVDSKVV